MPNLLVSNADNRTINQSQVMQQTQQPLMPPVPPPFRQQPPPMKVFFCFV